MGVTLNVVAIVAIVIAGWLILGAIVAFALGRAIQLREKYETPTSGSRDNTSEEELLVTDGTGINQEDLVFAGGFERKSCS
ncbi:hypothetical protein [Paeniglutamicibacter sp. Y32M11]|uniref:hypothetical protein n=1 Tax=Paeniglutamicibacter sp. Y32M11 TaxID=2853258 RepID=UPI001C531B3F|nr:hypothetical protein [Paeniglutamicibacter sp. Y32M11]QXQ10113.1 hypothetical protein KUF55_17030 [Paeniglutamicibacter sp. Y32M11]